MSQLEIAKLQGRIEMIDYILDAFCVSELVSSARTHLKGLKFEYKYKVDEYKRSNDPDKGGCTHGGNSDSHD
jgi:hypothetical protein